MVESADSESYILYVNGKPYTSYKDIFSAKSDFELLKKKFPNKIFEIKKEVCNIEPVTQENTTDNVSEKKVTEKQDACYRKVKSRYKVWPSAYASGALVQCRKKGAAKWGNESESTELENVDELDEDLHKWFKEKWVRFGPDGEVRGDCARGDDSEGKPKCLPQRKAHELGKKGRASAAARKRREDPNPERSGKAINVSTNKKSTEGVDDGDLEEACWKGYKQVGMKSKGKKAVPNCVPVSESIQQEMYNFIQILENKAQAKSGNNHASK